MSQLYVLTDSNLTPESSIFEQVSELLSSGVKFVQYRNKNKSYNLNLLSNLNKLCAKFEAKFIIDDDALLAHEIGASGVHIGKDDISLNEARKILGQKAIIGVSCYADLERALTAQNGGASYVAFGAMYTSPTKPNAPLCPHEIVIEAKKILKIPVCVIGGINANNITNISNLNPDLIAIVSAAWEGGEIAKNISNLKSSLKTQSK